MGSSSDDRFLAVSDTSSNGWIVGRDGGEPLALHGAGSWSPTSPEFAFVDDQGALRVRSTNTSDDRVVVDGAVASYSVRWSRDGLVVAYTSLDDAHLVSASDGTALPTTLPGTPVGFDSEGWLLVADGKRSTFATMAVGGARSEARRGLDSAWLRDGRIGYIDEDRLHVVTREGTDDQSLCDAKYMIHPQARRRY